METEFLDDPIYVIREREMQKIHEYLAGAKSKKYEGKSIFLKKMVYALIDATSVVPKTPSTLTIESHTPQKGLEHEHLEFQKSKIDTPRIQTPYEQYKPKMPTQVIAKSPILAQKIQQRLMTAHPLVEPKITLAPPKIKEPAVVIKPQIYVPQPKTQPQVQIKKEVPKSPSLDEGIPVPTPPRPKGSFAVQGAEMQKQELTKQKELEFPTPAAGIKPQEIEPHKFDIKELFVPARPKPVGGIPVGQLKQEIKPPKQLKPKIEQKVEVPKEVSLKKDIVSIEDLPEIGDEEILKIKSIPQEEQKYMPPIQPEAQEKVDISEIVAEQPKATIQKTPDVYMQVKEIQPTMMKIDRPQKQAFEIEHHAPEEGYKELEPVERRFIPLGQEIELAATPIQRKAQSIMPPPPKPVGGQVSKTEQLSSSAVSFLDINPRSGVREMEGNILYEVADPFSSPLQEVFEFVRLNVFVNPNKINDVKFLDESFKKMSKQLNIVIQEKDKKEIVTKVNEYINGFGKIRDMISDPSVSAIYCSGLNKPISIDFKLIGRIQTNVLYQDKLELERLIKNMVRMAGRQITESNPIVEGTIPPNIKIEATLGGDFISSKFIIKKV